MSSLNDAFWLENEENINAAIHTLGSTGMPINITKICEQLTSCIVESYDNATSLFVYKTAWCSRISKVLNDLNIKYGKTRPNWEHIAMAINDKRLGLSHYAPQAPGNVGSGGSELSSLTTTSSDSSSSTTKQLKLSPDDKEKVKHMFNNLNESKMWKLSTGTIVEKKMKEFALNCTYEHPVHSMILDLSDINWKKYLTDEEIDEIENFKMKQLVELPPNVNEYIKSLQKSTDAISLKRQLTQELECPASDWIRNTLLEYLKLFKYNHLPLTDQSEGDVLRRVWIFLDTVFDDSKISCRGGEKSSKSSSATRNNERAIAGEEKMERKLIGRKVDLLFKRQHLEYGCSECGRYEDQTKELYDGSFKMVKVLKDMLYNLHKTAPNSVREFILVGFLMFENKFSLVLCDSPMGYVTRINRIDPLFLPEEPDDINIKLLPILKTVYQARLTMEQTNELVRKYVPEVKVTSKNSRFISPCFNTGKRKRSHDTSTKE